jgi:hypothetical protein
MSSPFVTVSGISYEFSALNDRCRSLISDLVRTAQEYQALLANYRQSLTLTNVYSGGLKEQVEKADLPQVFSYAVDPETPIIKIDDTSYDASNLPDEVKAYVSELVKANKQKTSVEYRLRQLDAARSAFNKAIQLEIESSQPTPMDPQPEKADDVQSESESESET